MSSHRSEKARPARRNDDRVIIHFDYDCFYASVFEAEKPALKSLPLAVQQKQIIVTCNYEARRRGLRKLQLIREAKKICPDVIIVLGEDLTRFRDASKSLYAFLRNRAWSGRIEKLGFDEVFLDVTDMIDYNIDLLNPNDLSASFFNLDKSDPTLGFPYDASQVYGEVYPSADSDAAPEGLRLRLILGSHLAQHLRHTLEEEKGYTATVGISTSKLLSKLIGNVHKPRNQTTLLPPYQLDTSAVNNVLQFIDSHDLGRIPGIGFKLAQKIRSHVLGRPATFDEGLIYGGTKEGITVRDARLFPGMGSELLEQLLGGPGSPKGIGGKVWDLLNGVDDSEVAKARDVPRQISIEDSYLRLDTIEEVKKELVMLSASLIRRLRMDLTDDEDDLPADGESRSLADLTNIPLKKRWLAHPRTIRLSTRPRPPLSADGTRSRAFNRISRSGAMPNFIFSLTENIDALAQKLVSDTLLSMFRKLHPEKSAWNLSLVNIAATNMAEAAADHKDSSGRDIGRMFKTQENVLKEWKFEDRDVPPSDDERTSGVASPSEFGEGTFKPEVDDEDAKIQDQAWWNGHDRGTGTWDSDEEEQETGVSCPICKTRIPSFAWGAHETFHKISD